MSISFSSIGNSQIGHHILGQIYHLLNDGSELYSIEYVYDSFLILLFFSGSEYNGIGCDSGLTFLEY